MKKPIINQHTPMLILFADHTSNNCDDPDNISKQMRMLNCRSNRLVRLFNKCIKPVLLELCRSLCTVFYYHFFGHTIRKLLFSKKKVA